jgi:hypothetical protein
MKKREPKEGVDKEIKVKFPRGRLRKDGNNRLGKLSHRWKEGYGKKYRIWGKR